MIKKTFYLLCLQLLFMSNLLYAQETITKYEQDIGNILDDEKEPIIKDNEDIKQTEIKINKKDISMSFYGKVVADFVYGYGSESNTFNKISIFNNGYHTLGSNNFLKDSYFGVDMRYQNINVLIELGLEDYVRKYFVKYNFNDRYKQHLLFGRANTLAYYDMGQILGNQGLMNFGALNSDNRRLQLRYGIENLQVALIMPYLGKGYKLANDNAFFTTNSRDDYLGFAAIPRFEMAYNYKNNNLNIKAFGSYGAYLYIQEYTKKQDLVHTASIGLGGRYNYLPQGFMDFTVWGGMNLYLTNAINNERFNPIKHYVKDFIEGNKFLDNFGHNNMYHGGLALSFGYEFQKDSIRYVPQVGAGYMITYSPYFKQLDHETAIYFNTAFKFNDYIHLIPEISFMHSLNGGYLSNEGFNILVGINAVFQF